MTPSAPSNWDSAISAIINDERLIAYAYRSWSPAEREIAAAARMLARRLGVGDRWHLAAVVGGASSGKSTIFNNLLGGRHLSQVTMRGHTTQGPVVAAPYAIQGKLEAARSDGTLLPGREWRSADSTAPIRGGADVLTVVGAAGDAFPDAVLLDTPDFTTRRADREGDLTYRLLPWFDRVLVVIDPDRTFDRQTFGRLRETLDRFGVERFVVFNRNESGDELSDDERNAIADRARILQAEHVLFDYRAGIGLLSFPPDVLAPLVSWLASPVQRSQQESRVTTLRRELIHHAGLLLNENTERSRRFSKLQNELDRSLKDRLPANRRVVWEALISPQHRKTLQPLWRVVGRSFENSADWVAKQVRNLAFWKRSDKSKKPAIEAGDQAASGGETYFVETVASIRERLWSVAYNSPYWREASLEKTPMGISLSEEERAEARQLTRECLAAFEAFREAVVRTAASRNLHMGSATVGALLGAAFGLVLAAPTGGLSMPAGAVIGGLISSPGLTLSLPALLRLYQELRGYQESSDFELTVEAYRAGIRRQTERTRDTILEVARERLLAPDDAVVSALEWICTQLADAQLSVERS